MGRERHEFIRISDAVEREKMFLLAYEGNETEPDYFEALKKDYKTDIVEIVSLRRDKKDTKSAPKYVFEKLKNIKEEYDLGKNDELWMIIDRDRNRKNIDKYHNECKKETNFYLALNNPCFELWLLLHLKDLSEFTAEELIKIEENKKISSSKNSKTYLKKLLSNILPNGYNESKLRPDDFLPHIDLAIERSKQLDNPKEEYPTKIGSHLFKLVEKIITPLP